MHLHGFLTKEAFMKRKMKGFTLVELVIVIAIIGILIAIGFPRFAEATQGSKNRAIEANSKSIFVQIQAFVSDKSEQPDVSEITDIIDRLNIDKTGIVYRASIEDYGVKVEYESVSNRYSGTVGYRIEPNTVADVDNNANLNDGSMIDKTWFVYRTK